MTAFFHTIISVPFYNGFILLISALPFFDAGVVVIVFTLIIKLILLPVSIKASLAQLQQKSVEKDINLIKDKYKDNKEEQSRKIMEHYKSNGINPFAGIFIAIIQLPILIGLYRVFLRSGLPVINTAMLYSFVKAPVTVNMIFIHLLDISQKSLILAIIAGVTTYFQVSYASSAQPVQGGKQGDIASAMAVQMKYLLPIFMVYIAYIISVAGALYLITSNVFAIGQEIYIKKKYHKAALVV